MNAADAAVQALWSVLRGHAVERLPSGISAVAAKHHCGAALYSSLELGGLRHTVDYSDWCLLRAFAFFHRARARRVREILQKFAADAPSEAPWFVWKGAALLLLVDGYDERFEAGDVDLAVRRDGIDAWLDYLSGIGAEIFRRSANGFQARLVASDLQIVLDVKAEDEMPPLELVSEVPVPIRERHIEAMREHARKHAGLPAPKLRLAYDGYLVGADWHEEVFRTLFPGAVPEAATVAAPPDTNPDRMACRIEGDGCLICIDADRPFAFDGERIRRALPRLFAGPAPRRAAAHLDARLDADAWPYAIEERSDRVVLWVRRAPSVRENRHLVAAMVQRAWQAAGLLTLHCTAAVRDGRAVALLGSFGAGKTVTSLRLCAEGASLAAGDAALIEIEGGVTIAGGTREAWLDVAVRDRCFSELSGQASEDGARVDVAAALPWLPLSEPPPSLAGIVFVNAGAKDFVSPLARDTAVQNLFRASSYRFDTMLAACELPLTELEPRAQRQWRAHCCGAVAESVPVLRAGGSLEHVAGVALGLLMRREAPRPA